MSDPVNHAQDRLGPPRGAVRAYATSTSPKAIDLSADFPAAASAAIPAGSYHTDGVYWTIAAFGADLYYVTQANNSVAGGNAILPAALDASTPAQQCFRLAAGAQTEIRLRSGEQFLQVATAAGTGEVRIHPSSGTLMTRTR